MLRLSLQNEPLTPLRAQLVDEAVAVAEKRDGDAEGRAAGGGEGAGEALEEKVYVRGHMLSRDEVLATSRESFGAFAERLRGKALTVSVFGVLKEVETS